MFRANVPGCAARTARRPRRDLLDGRRRRLRS